MTLPPAASTAVCVREIPAPDPLASFERLLYFPPDPAYAVRAELVEHASPEQVVMLTNRNLEKIFFRFATLRFELASQKLELSAFKRALDGEKSDALFIPFRDATSGRETYGAGRFLSIDVPSESPLVLDFNRAYNPYCAYNPKWICPVTPAENVFGAAVPAGEKNFAVKP